MKPVELVYCFLIGFFKGIPFLATMTENLPHKETIYKVVFYIGNLFGVYSFCFFLYKIGFRLIDIVKLFGLLT